MITDLVLDARAIVGYVAGMRVGLHDGVYRAANVRRNGLTCTLVRESPKVRGKAARRADKQRRAAHRGGR